MEVERLQKIIFHLNEAENLIRDGVRSSNSNDRYVFTDMVAQLLTYKRIIKDFLHLAEKKLLEDWKARQLAKKSDTR